MNMKRKKQLILWLILSLGLTANSYAQRVYKERTMFIFEAEGMPAGSYTREAKPAVHASSTNNAAGVNTLENLASKECNKTIAYKFEIASANESGGNKNWRSAVDACANKGNGWRLPTQRELFLMQIFKNALKELSGFSPIGGDCWSATEEGTQSYFVTFNGNYTTRAGKERANPVRCVRDIVPPLKTKNKK